MLMERFTATAYFGCVFPPVVVRLVILLFEQVCDLRQGRYGRIFIASQDLGFIHAG